MSAPLTYADAGVSIDAGNKLVDNIKAIVKSTHQPGTASVIGGFGGLFDLDAAGFPGAPTLVSGIDGIGTKVKIAFSLDKHDTVGIDLVAMNVNDLVVQGAKPLFFLDYFACSALDVDQTTNFVRGVAAGCKLAGAALVGGETAEMPGIYSHGEYDAAGCAVGAIAHGAKVLPDLESMKEGDVLLGLASSGFHSNGYSLVRAIVDRHGLDYNSAAAFDQGDSTGSGSTKFDTLGQALLEPTRIYVSSVLAACKADLVKGMAHITGGGLVENVPRMLPKHLDAEIDASTYPVPAVMRYLKKLGQVEDGEFAKVWNTGVGMVLVVDAEKADEAVKVLEEAGEKVYRIGKLVGKGAEAGAGAGEGAVCRVINTAEAWKTS